jgi:hypothetical protein
MAIAPLCTTVKICVSNAAAAIGSLNCSESRTSGRDLLHMRFELCKTLLFDICCLL